MSDDCNDCLFKPLMKMFSRKPIPKTKCSINQPNSYLRNLRNFSLVLQSSDFINGKEESQLDATITVY